jgi:hypothetical protein
MQGKIDIGTAKPWKQSRGMFGAVGVARNEKANVENQGLAVTSSEWSYGMRSQ